MRYGLGFGLSTMMGGYVDPSAALLATLRSGASQLIAHPLEYGSMFQDRAGTIPVTESGQLLGQVLDIGGGDFHATAISDAARGVFRDVGGKRWVEYSGVNTAYKTPVLPAPGVDKAQMFAGLRKLSDAASGTVIELSPSTTTSDGSFALQSSFDGFAVSNEWLFTSKGSVRSGVVSSGAAVAPSTKVITSIGDISGDRSTLRFDGIQVAQATIDQGTGNFNPSGTYPLYYGARAGTSRFFNGYHYQTLGPIVRFGTNATPEQIAAAEAYYTVGLPA